MALVSYIVALIEFTQQDVAVIIDHISPYHVTSQSSESYYAEMISRHSYYNIYVSGLESQ